MLNSRRLLRSSINSLRVMEKVGGCVRSAENIADFRRQSRMNRWASNSFSSCCSSMGDVCSNSDGTSSFSCKQDNHEEGKSSYYSHAPLLSAAAASPALSSSSRIVDVAPLAEAMRAKVREYTSQQNDAIRLVGIVATNPNSHDGDYDDGQEPQNGSNHAAALVYSEQIAETFAQDGIEYEMISCTARHPLDVEAVIQEMNQRDDVHGILVFYPIFKSTVLAASTSAASAPNKPVANHASSDDDTNVQKEVEPANSSPRYYLNRVTGVRYKSPDDYLRDLVSPEKDVEGLRQNNNNNNNNSSATGHLFRARGGLHDGIPQDVYVPCTAQAVMKILAMYHTNQHQQKHEIPAHQPQSSSSSSSTRLGSSTTVHGSHRRWLGCTATVINRSEICGLPLAALLALEGATVYSVDETSILEFVQQDESSKSRGSNNGDGAVVARKMRRSNKTLQECLMESSIIITGVPSQDFALPTNAIQKGTTVINVSEYPLLDQDALLQRPGIQFIPQIGKVTVAALEQNLIRLHQQQQQQQQRQDGQQEQ